MSLIKNKCKNRFKVPLKLLLLKEIAIFLKISIKRKFNKLKILDYGLKMIKANYLRSIESFSLIKSKDF